MIPYYYPTTVAFLDDNLDYLENLVLPLDSTACRLFSRSDTALKALNIQQNHQPLYSRCFTYLETLSRFSDNEHCIKIDLKIVQQEIRNQDRFSEVSVVVVDYAMPDGNGIEFCEKLNAPGVKKLLLTGVADSTVAVDAFNNGTIDRFLTKQDPDISNKLPAAISELQSAYFEGNTAPLGWGLSIGAPTFFNDRLFQEFFSELCEKHHIVEYYFVSQPPGFLLVTSDGRLMRLLVLTEKDFGEHEILADSRNASSELLTRLKERRSIPYFWTTEDGFYNSDCYNWWSYIRPAQQLIGESELFYYALVEDPPNYSGLLNVNASYNSYLDWLDRQRSDG